MSGKDIIDISDFVPVYPDEPESEDITKRLEFNTHWSDPERDRLIAESFSDTVEFFEHQRLIINYLMIYDRLFMFHRAGTGKTYSFLGATENFRNLYHLGLTNIKRVVILAEAKGNISKQLLRYIKTEKVPDYYLIVGYQQFLNMINENNYRTYDDTFFIIDEAHNLKKEIKILKKNLDTDDEIYQEETPDLKDDKIQHKDIKNVEKLYDLFNEARRIKICVATATPVFDSPKDIISTMNFLLPKNRWINESDLNSYDSMKQKIGNIVSFISELKTGISIKYVKNGPLNIMPGLYEIELSDFQKTKIEECSKDCRKMESKSLIIGLEYSAGNIKEKLTLEILKKTSPKCHFIIAESMKKETGSCFAFSALYSVNIIDFTKKALLDNGFEEYKGGKLTTKKLRFLSYESFLNEKERNVFIDEFNEDKNVNGEYIKLFLSGPVGAEGINLRNVITVFNMTPSWNYSRTYQGISRAYRSTSHSLLLKSGLPVTLKVYLLCSVNQKVKTNDVFMYEICYEKDKEIKRLERILKRISFDCNINYNRNHVNSEDYSPECDYDICDYVCDFNPDNREKYNNYLKFENTFGLKDEYNILFAGDAVRYLKIKIRNLLQIRGKINIDELYSLFNTDKQIIYEAIDLLLMSRDYVIDIFGFYNYVYHYGNQLILIKKIENKKEIGYRYNTDFFHNNLLAYNFKDLDTGFDNVLKVELEKKIKASVPGQGIVQYDNNVLLGNRIYWFCIDKTDYETLMNDLKKPKQGKKPVSGNPTDQQILMQKLPLPKKLPNFDPDTEIFFTNVFLKELKDRKGISKTGFVPEILSSKDGETEKVEYYDYSWKISLPMSSILRNIIKNYYSKRFIDAFEKMNVNGNLYSVFPDNIIRIHVMKKGIITPGLDIINTKAFDTRAYEDFKLNKTEIMNYKKNPNLFIKFLESLNKIFIFETYIF